MRRSPLTRCKPLIFREAGCRRGEAVVGWDMLVETPVRRGLVAQCEGDVRGWMPEASSAGRWLEKAVKGRVY